MTLPPSLYVTQPEFLNQSLPIKLIEHFFFFFTQISKILMHLLDRGGRSCLLACPIMPFIIITQPNYFYPYICLEKRFPGICNRNHLPVLNFKDGPL